MQVHQKKLVSLESILILSIQILWSVCTLRHTNNRNTDHKSIFLCAVCLYPLLFPFITFAKSAAFCKNLIERSAFLLDITKLRTVIPLRRFGETFRLIFNGLEIFLDILILEGGIDSKNLHAECKQTRKSHLCVRRT